MVKTDSSVIETKYYESLNSIRIFNTLNNQDKVYYTDYYYDTRKINEQGVMLNGNFTGIVKFFWPTGKLKLKVDYSTGKIHYFDKKAFPFLDYQNNIKLKADEIIKTTYSPAFFEKYVVWDIGDSYIYSGESSGSWLDAIDQKPTNFLLRYAIRMNGKRYPELIEFQVDSKGKLVQGKNFKGFEKLPKGVPKTFSLSSQKAIQISIKNGLVDTGKSKAYSYLTWEQTTSNSGKFRIYVVKKTATIKKINPVGRSNVIERYDAYVFNPWSGVFIEKKKMKAIRSWEKESGSNTGLIPDL